MSETRRQIRSRSQVSPPHGLLKLVQCAEEDEVVVHNLLFGDKSYKSLHMSRKKHETLHKQSSYHQNYIYTNM